MSSGVRTKLKRYRLSIIFLGLAGALAGIGACVPLDKLIKVDVPPKMQAMTGEGPRIELRNAELIWEQFDLSVRHEAVKYQRNVDQAMALYGFVGSLWDATRGQLAAVAPGLPGGALALSALTAAGTLFIPPPGTRRREESAYRRGREDEKNGETD